jgi:hypothetical protein
VGELPELDRASAPGSSWIPLSIGTSLNPRLEYMEFAAKNVGIRAPGDVSS